MRPNRVFRGPFGQTRPGGVAHPAAEPRVEGGLGEPAAFAAHTRSGVTKWAEVIRASGARVE